MPTRVDDLMHPAVQIFRGVSDPSLLRDHDLFMAESRTVLRRLIQEAGLRPSKVLLGEAAWEALKLDLVDLDANSVFVAPTGLVTALAGFKLHQGCLAVFQRPTRPGLDALSSDDSSGCSSVWLGFEALANPDHLGSLTRTAYAMGVAGIITDQGSTDPYYRKAIRTSMATTLMLPMLEIDSWADRMPEIIRRGITPVALVTDSAAPAISDLKPPRCPLLLLGNEGSGLSPSTMAAAPVRARIPMARPLDSLSVAHAGAIALYWATHA